MRTENGSSSSIADREAVLADGTDYERIFHPRRVAVAGVSPGGGIGFGTRYLTSLLAMGFEGEVFPVNPKGGEIAGLSIYKNVEDIPGELDLIVIAVAAEAVLPILEAGRQKGAAGAVIITSGFRELGTAEGIAREEEVRRIADSGIRVIGPNCFGIYCPKSGLTFFPNPDLSRESGPVAFLSQSGGLASDFMMTGMWTGLRFSKVVSFGNGADLREAELLRYLGEDPETGVIAMYVEGVRDGDEFLEALKFAAGRKPVVILKGGLSSAGGRAVVSHTASLGGSRVIWESVLRQAGAVQVRDLQEMAQACLAFSMLPGRAYRGLSFTGGGGALGIAACDAAEAFGLEVPPLGAEARNQVESLLPKSGASGANPIDVANPYTPPALLEKVFRAAAGDGRIDLQVLILLAHHFKGLALDQGKAIEEAFPYRELADRLHSVAAETGKPVAVVLPNAKRGLPDMDVVEVHAKVRQALLEKGVPVFDETGEVMRAVGHVNRFYGRYYGKGVAS
ncbi:MAG TPA: CoA-binding protein [Syntrophales bacterium]|nr:CoA-binding protein [Syntrophales bacterium]